ncbi:restriction endonuclease subunit S [Candidatus Neomarinimicrobiota bacterium]
MTGWRRAKLTDLADFINGYPFKPDDWGDEGLPIIRIEQLKNPDKINDYYSGELNERQIIEDGDLILSWSASLCLRIWQHGRAALNQHLFKVVNRKDVHRYFLKSLAEHYLPELGKIAHGSTMQHITRKELESFEVLLPRSYTEQVQIAGIVSIIDNAIDQAEALVTKQQRIKNGFMQELLTKGIGDDNSIRSEETHEFRDSKLGRVPQEWDVTQLGKLLISGPKNGYSPQEAEKWTGIHILGLGCLTYSGFKPLQLKNAPSGDKKLDQFLLHDGDFLISRSNTRDLVGLCGIFKVFDMPCIYPDLMMRIKCNDMIRPEFLELILLSPIGRFQFKAAAAGTSGSMVKINSDHIRELWLPIPSLEEQDRILALMMPLNKRITSTEDNLSKLRHIKIGLLQDLFSGNFQVSYTHDHSELT